MVKKSIKFKENYYLDSKGIVHNQKLLSELLDNLYYKKNTSYYIPYRTCSGFLSGGGKEVSISIPMDKLLTDTNEIELENLDIVVRGVTGHLISRTQNKTNWLVSKASDTMIQLFYSTTTSLGTNNTPISATIYGGTKVRFK